MVLFSRMLFSLHKFFHSHRFNFLWCLVFNFSYSTLLFFNLYHISLDSVSDSLFKKSRNKSFLERQFGGSQAIAIEISSFLMEPPTQDITVLERFPVIKQMYLKYNCIFCSEADVERVFSYAGKNEFMKTGKTFRSKETKCSPNPNYNASSVFRMDNASFSTI